MTLRSAIITGTASININGTVGATTPSTGAFTTLSATGNVTFQKTSGNTLLVENTASTANVVLSLKQTTGTFNSGINATTIYYDDTASREIVWYSNGTERLRIYSGGGLLVTGTLTSTGTISPQQATTAGAPAYVKGAIYFDTTLNKLRVGGATAWETINSV